MLVTSDSKKIIEDWIHEFKQLSRAANLSNQQDAEDSISNVGSGLSYMKGFAKI